MSSSNVVLDSSNHVFPAVAVSSSTSGLPNNTIDTSSGVSGALGGTKRFATYASDVWIGDYGEGYSFTGHTQASTFASLFGACYVEYVRFTLVSLQAFATGTQPRIFRFGIVPRGTAKSLAKKPQAGNIPWLQNFVVGATHHNQATVTYARNPRGDELPFPPGLQLDLNATEVRFKYPTPVVLHSTYEEVTKENNKPLVSWHLEFGLTGEGVSFGAPFSE
jgi:hypothetical protein